MDGSGNVYVADSNNMYLKQMPANCFSSACVTTLRSVGYPSGIAVDGAENLYVADGSLTEFQAVGSYNTTYGLATSTSVNGASSVAVISNGNVFFTNGNAIQEFDYADAPSINYPTSTVVGVHDSTDGTQTVALSNIGTASLTFSAVTYPTDFSASSGFPGSCSSSAPLAAGSLCKLPINFTPTQPGAPLSESLLLVGNSTSGANLALSISLTGSALPAPVATTLIHSTVLTMGQPASAFEPVAGSGGTGALTYSISPTLPTGLSLSSSTGTVSGSPTASTAATTYTITVTDANSATATASFTLQIDTAVVATQDMASTSLTANQPATTFTPVTGSGGAASLTYSISPALPTGLNFSSSTGTISGSPIAAIAATTYTITVTDANRATATATFSLTTYSAVQAAQAIASTSLTVYQPSTMLTAVPGSGGDGSLTYSISPALPTGLSLSSSTGTISGSPTASTAATTYTVTVTDAHHATATATFSLAVNKQTSTIIASVGQSSITPNQSVTLIATVAATISDTPVMPVGTVTFFDGSTQLGSPVSVTNGVATLLVSTLPPARQRPSRQRTPVMATFLPASRTPASSRSQLRLSTLPSRPQERRQPPWHRGPWQPTPSLFHRSMEATPVPSASLSQVFLRAPPLPSRRTHSRPAAQMHKS